jgi:NAD(P)-dependent dehydrogenase (short-subunit alcohol dehydrogenase family)
MTLHMPLTDDRSLLAGHVALVTGASSGIGHQFARTLAAAGANVVACARRVERLDELSKQIAEEGGTCVGVECDVRDAESIVAAVDAAEAAFGTVTLLVNNAGIPDAQRATKMSLELVDNVLDTNIRGVWLMAVEVARRLMEAKQPGRIVNISSTGAYNYAGGGAALYSVTKAAVNRITESLAVEWSRFGINVNGIAPGATNSEMMDGMISRIGEMAPMFPRKRMMDPSALDSALLFFMSPASEAVTGSTVIVDDGQGSR